jgi:hypothetical protein
MTIETDIINMLEFLIDNIFVIFGGRVFQQTVGIPIGTKCAPLLADLFLYSYETNFIQGLLKKSEKKLARPFHFTFRYIDDVLSLNYSRFGEFVDRIYLIELAIKDTTDRDTSALYLDLHREIGSEGRLRTKLYDKRDDCGAVTLYFSVAPESPPDVSGFVLLDLKYSMYGCVDRGLSFVLFLLAIMLSVDLRLLIATLVSYKLCLQQYIHEQLNTLSSS